MAFSRQAMTDFKACCQRTFSLTLKLLLLQFTWAGENNLIQTGKTE